MENTYFYGNDFLNSWRLNEWIIYFYFLIVKSSRGSVTANNWSDWCFLYGIVYTQTYRNLRYTTLYTCIFISSLNYCDNASPQRNKLLQIAITIFWSHSSALESNFQGGVLATSVIWRSPYLLRKPRGLNCQVRLTEIWNLT